MQRLVLAAALLAVAGVATAPQRASALGCDPKTQVSGHTKGSFGITDVPTGPCPVGHYANLEKKRSQSALFVQPKNAPLPQNGVQQ